MNRALYSNGLKIFSSSGAAYAARLLCAASVLAAAFGCAPARTRSVAGPSAPQKPVFERKVRAPKDIPVPPWQLWQGTLDSAEIAAAERAQQRGELEEALFYYRDAMDRSTSVRVYEEAQLRLFGTLLKLGRTEEVLKGISTYLDAQNLEIKDIGERYALLIAYAYLAQGNTDQALAWLTTAYRASDGQGIYSLRAKQELAELIQELPPAKFEQFEQRWRVDDVAGRLFAKERIRRAQGGKIRFNSDPDWFSASTYRMVLPPEVPDAALASAAQGPMEGLQPARTDPTAMMQVGGRRAIGVLLPLSGRFAEHALKVKEGISLAAANARPQVEVIFADTRGDPVTAEQEYARLAEQEGVSVVLGPLLVKEAEQVALRSRDVGLPFITFTKRSGVPQLGSAVFRLGATLEDQVDELLTYGTSQLGLQRFAVLYPEDSSGREFAELFRATVRAMGVELTGMHGYYPGDESSIDAAVAEAALGRPEAVFLPDSLESAFPVLDRLQTSEMTNAVLLGPAQWNDPVAIRGYGQLIDGAVYVTPFYSASRDPGVGDFIADYTERYQHAPELLAAQAYDAATLAIQSLNSPQAPSAQESLINRLSEVDVLNGVTGRLQVQSSGEIRRRMTVLRLYRGRIIEVMAGGVATGFYPGEQTKAASETAPFGTGG